MRTTSAGPTCLLLSLLCACAGEGPPSGPSEASPPTETKAGETAKTDPSPTAAEAAPSHQRLSAEAITALGDQPQSACEHKELAGLELGGCKVRGPYPGAITGGTKKDDVEEYRGALDACVADPTCIGISSQWYLGAPWYPVTGAATFSADKDSYACTLVLDCN